MPRSTDRKPLDETNQVSAVSVGAVRHEQAADDGSDDVTKTDRTTDRLNRHKRLQPLQLRALKHDCRFLPRIYVCNT